MRKTILLLDDDPDEGDVLRDAFSNLDMEVDLHQFLNFSQLENFLDVAIALPEMLLLDINLPGQTGIECIRLLQGNQHYATLPIVMYTNAADERTIDQCFELGASAYVKKTNSILTLMDHLKILMAWNIQTIFNLPVTQRTFLN